MASSSNSEQLRIAITVALEAMGVQDYLALVVLLQALEDEPLIVRYRCVCDAEFQWVGLQAAHRDRGCPAASPPRVFHGLSIDCSTKGDFRL